jgi:RNA polymerase sigma factor (sigma-70 family)
MNTLQRIDPKEQKQCFENIKGYKTELNKIIEKAGIKIPLPKRARQLHFEDKLDYCLENLNNGYKEKLRDMQNSYFNDRNKIVEGNAPFVVKIAGRYLTEDLEMDDLIQEGKLGLMEAVEKYNPNLGYNFLTYAGYWIRQSILNGIGNNNRNIGQNIRIPMNAKSDLSKYLKQIKHLNLENARNASRQEISSRLGISLEKVGDLEKQISLSQDISLDNTVGEDGETALIDILDLDKPKGSSEDRSYILQKLKSLNKRRRDIAIFKLYNGLSTGYSMPAKQVGNIFSITHQRVAMINNEIIEELKKSLKNPDYNPQKERQEKRIRDIQEGKQKLEIAMQMGDEYFGMSHAARLLNINKGTLYLLIKKEKLKLKRAEIYGLSYRKYLTKAQLDYLNTKVRRRVRKKEENQALLA